MEIKKDKGLHFIVGLTIFLFTWFAFNINIGLIVVILAGLGKELYDTFIKKTGFDYFDFLATIIVPIIIYALA